MPSTKDVVATQGTAAQLHRERRHSTTPNLLRLREQTTGEWTVLYWAPHNEDKGSNHSTAQPLRSLPHLGYKFSATTPSSQELWSDLIRAINFRQG